MDARYKILMAPELYVNSTNYRGANKYLARPTSRCILFDG